MTGRPDQQSAPELPGYTFRSVLGRGGFADVFLYEQDRARRDVAVKVLRERVDRQQDRAAITAEAEVMAQLSTHPYIVTIYDADVAPDGRPYLVMEYYSKPNFARRARNAGFDVPEALRVGVQVASAVETAHRAGIVHRDIKPANILTSDYGRPGLTDFGISSRAGSTADEEGALSIPWAAPELFRDGVVPDHRADIYALGATLWTLLVGRSPFEAPGGDNSEMVLWYRIEQSPVPQTGRGDAPASLERVLRQAMAKRPEQRFTTALEFARELQTIQGELQLAVEPVALPDLGLTTSRPKRPRGTAKPAAPGAGPGPGPGSAADQEPDPDADQEGDQESVVTVLRSPRTARPRPGVTGADPGATRASGHLPGRTAAMRENRGQGRPAGRPAARTAADGAPSALPGGLPTGAVLKGFQAPPSLLLPPPPQPQPALPPQPAAALQPAPAPQPALPPQPVLPPQPAPAPPAHPRPAERPRRPKRSKRSRAPRTPEPPRWSAAADPRTAATAAAAGRRRRWTVIGAAAALAVLVPVGVLLATQQDDPDQGDATSPTGTADPIPTQTAKVNEILSGSQVITGTARWRSPTSVRFTWTAGRPAEVVDYLLTREDKGHGAQPAGLRVKGTSYDLSGVAPDDRPCLWVSATDTNGHASPRQRICATR